jgi:hypothetical protein
MSLSVRLTWMLAPWRGIRGLIALLWLAAAGFGVATLLRPAPPAAASVVAPPPVPRDPFAALPDRDDSLEQAARVQQLARRHGLELARVRYRVESRDGLVEQRIDLPLRGSYPALRAFLDEVLRDEPGVAIAALRLRRDDRGDAEIRAEVSLVRYRREAT